MGLSEDNQLSKLRFVWRTFRATDQAMHSWVMGQFPRTMSIVDRILESLFEGFGHGAFGVFAALLLVALVATNVIPVIVAVSLGGAWIIAVVWLARLRPVKSLTVISRWLVVLIGGTVFALAANSFARWALHQVSLQKSGETAQHTSEPKQSASQNQVQGVATLEVKPALSNKVEIKPAEHPKSKLTHKSSATVPSAAIQPEMGFHESTDVYFFTLGENGISASATVAGLRIGQKPFVGFPITVFAKDTDNKIHYRISIWNGMSPVEVTDDVFSLHEPFWDRNFDKSALEIVDEKQAPVLQVIWKTPTNLVINGIFRLQNGSVVIADSNGWRPMKPGDNIKPLFKYPSRRFQGQYADQ